IVDAGGRGGAGGRQRDARAGARVADLVGCRVARGHHRPVGRIGRVVAGHDVGALAIELPREALDAPGAFLAEVADAGRLIEDVALVATLDRHVAVAEHARGLVHAEDPAAHADVEVDARAARSTLVVGSAVVAPSVASWASVVVARGGRGATIVARAVATGDASAAGGLSVLLGLGARRG